MEIPRIEGTFLNRIKGLSDIIKTSEKIVFFGGAGTSTDCGVKDFRSADGLYNEKSRYKYPPEVMLSKTFLNSKPKEFYEFYRNEFNLSDIKPNITHYSLAELEQKGKLSAIITQNIDGLHQLGGSKNVIELHGTIHKNYCPKCRKKDEFSENYSSDYIFNKTEGLPKCPKCDQILRPDIVLYEENLKKENLNDAYLNLTNADTLIISGTSLKVQPAANLINNFYGPNIIMINRDETHYDNYCNIIFRENVSEVFESLKQCMEE